MSYLEVNTSRERLPVEKTSLFCSHLTRGNVEQVMKDLKSQASKSTTPGKGGLTPEIQSRIGHQLRAMYDDVVRQGVPDRFAELIKKLDAPGGSQNENGAGGSNDNNGRD